jgi:hypothetical protein
MKMHRYFKQKSSIIFAILRSSFMWAQLNPPHVEVILSDHHNILQNKNNWTWKTMGNHRYCFGYIIRSFDVTAKFLKLEKMWLSFYKNESCDANLRKDLSFQDNARMNPRQTSSRFILCYYKFKNWCLNRVRPPIFSWRIQTKHRVPQTSPLCETYGILGVVKYGDTVTLRRLIAYIIIYFRSKVHNSALTRANKEGHRILSMVTYLASCPKLIGSMVEIL